MRTRTKKLFSAMAVFAFATIAKLKADLPTVDTGNLETGITEIGRLAILAVSVLGFVFMAVRLFGAIQAVQKGDREGTDRAWMWGAGLVLYIIGAAILNVYIRTWGGN